MKTINFLNIPPANTCHSFLHFLFALFSFKVLYDSDEASTTSKEFLCLTASALLKVTEPLIIIRRCLRRNDTICKQIILWTQTLHQLWIIEKQIWSGRREALPAHQQTISGITKRVPPLQAAQLTRTCSSKGRVRGKSNFLLLFSSI